MKKLISALLILLSSFGFSQNYKGDIANVTESGFHQITISPNIRAFAKDDLRHFRILDSKQNQIPYTIAAGKKQSQNYNQLNIVSKVSITDSITSLIVENESAKKISQFNLQIENTSLVKSYTVSGSNDGNKWFGLVANETLQDMVSSSGTSVTKTINFPANTYKFLRIVLNDKKSLPINILSAGTSDMQSVPEKLIEIEQFQYKIIEDRVRKVTQIIFVAETAYQVDAIAFAISTDYYNRSSKVITQREQRSKKRTSVYDETLAYFDLNSKNNQTIYFTSINEKSFTIEIENQDNQALDISKIQVLQKPLVIISKLSADEKYKIILDTTLVTPMYDLAGFVGESTDVLASATITNFNKIDSQSTAKTEKSFWQTPLFMWACILLGGAIVAYFAYGLLKDMKEE